VFWVRHCSLPDIQTFIAEFIFHIIFDLLCIFALWKLRKPSSDEKSQQKAIFFSVIDNFNQISVSNQMNVYDQLKITVCINCVSIRTSYSCLRDSLHVMSCHVMLFVPVSTEVTKYRYYINVLSVRKRSRVVLISQGPMLVINNIYRVFLATFIIKQLICKVGITVVWRTTINFMYLSWDVVICTLNETIPSNGYQGLFPWG
jgi:hypothetical protein